VEIFPTSALLSPGGDPPLSNLPIYDQRLNFIATNLTCCGAGETVEHMFMGLLISAL
jgi:hypothetical protein